MVNIGWDLGKQAHIHIPLVGVYTRAFWRKIDNIYQSYTADSDCSYEIKRCLLFERKAITNPYSILKSRGITLPTKVLLVKAMVFPVVTYGCESWTIKKAERRRIDAFELWFWRTLLRVTLDSKEIKLVSPKGYQPWIFIGRTDAEADAPIFCLCDGKSQLIGKDPAAGKDWGQEEKGAAEDEMFGWHHWHDGHEFEQTPEDGEGQGSLVCCSPWGCKELDTTE